MAKLTEDVMFREDKTSGRDSAEIAALNFELQEALGSLEPGSREYIERAKAFHKEVSRR